MGLHSLPACTHPRLGTTAPGPTGRVRTAADGSLRYDDSDGPGPGPPWNETRLEVRMSLVMEQIRELAETIGPRPATTDAESRAADHIEDTMGAYGIDVERQEFDCPRSEGRATIVHGVLLIGAAVLAVWWSIPALVLAVLATVLIWLDASGRPVISRFLGSGPSQNLIGRHVPRARRNERLQRVVIVAHYDTARPSFLTSPGFVRHLGTVSVLTRWIPVGVSIWIALTALPFTASWKPWSGYVAVVGAAVMLLPVAAAIQELFSLATDGANDNASGVAAMLAVMAATVPGVDEPQRRAPVRRGQQAVEEAGGFDEDVLLEYRSVTPGSHDVQLPIGIGDIEETGPRAADVDVKTPGEGTGTAPSTPAGVGRYASYLEDEDPHLEDAEPAWGLDEAVPGQVSMDIDFEQEPTSEPSGGIPGAAGLDQEPSGRRRRSRSRRAEEDDEEGRGLRDWLGIGRGFDVRRAGKEIGSWDNLDDDDDEFGFKAGSAGETGPGEFADPSAIAARIRRQVIDGVDRALAEKEIWFVATGAKEAGGWGMRALLDAYGDELRDAMFINIDTVGAGGLSFVSREGGATMYRADRRLVAQAKRTARENDMPVKARERTGTVSDASVALSRGYRAMSVMAFDINGRLPNWHWHTDTIDAVSESTVEQAVQFVTALVRDL